LAEAKANGDNSEYFRLLANADLVLPATAPAVEDPDHAELPTIVIGSDTYVTVFTSPGALARTGDRHPSLYRRTSFAQLASGWPDPAWRLAINWGLPSEVLLDSSVVPRLHESPGAVPPAGQGVPNPYGTVDPNALSGPNPVAGGSPPGLNGSSSLGEGPHDDVPHAPLDDSHTAVDPFTAADLQAALDAGGPGRPVAPSAEAPPVPEPEPPAPQTSAPQAPAPQEPPPQEPPPQVPAPQVPAPQASAEPEPPEQLEPPRPGPEPKPEPEPVQPERLPHDHVQHQAERAQEEVVAPLGAPTRRLSAAQQQPAGVPIRLPHGARLWRWTGEGEETPLAVYDAVGRVWAPVRADAVQAPRTE
jgi:outer membrane biosynthesis protein TonB